MAAAFTSPFCKTIWLRQQIGFGQLALVLLKGLIVGGLGLQALPIDLRLWPARCWPRLCSSCTMAVARSSGGLGGRRWRALASAQQQRKCDKEQITGGERLHSCDSLFAQKRASLHPSTGQNKTQQKQRGGRHNNRRARRGVLEPGQRQPATHGEHAQQARAQCHLLR